MAAVLKEIYFNTPESFFSFIEGSFKGKCAIYIHIDILIYRKEELTLTLTYAKEESLNKIYAYEKYIDS